MLRASLAYAAAFAAVSVAVALGAFDAVDQWAVDHVMPWLSPITHPQTVVSIMRPFSSGDPGASIPLKLWTYPASVPLSALAVAAGCLVLWRRGRTRAALAWAAAWLAGDAVEVLGKGLLRRPELHMLVHGARVHLVGFDDSFPSGHTLRGVLVAVLVGTLWPRARPWAALWAAVTLAFLVVTSAHVPSDVLGGALLAAVFAVPAAALSRPRARA